MGLPTKNNTRGGVEYDKWKAGEPTGAPCGSACRSDGSADRSCRPGSDSALAAGSEHTRTRAGRLWQRVSLPPLT